ncbi:family 20 glycosylhydrolase [Mycolicibacterium sp. CBMA 334]|uniref:family 20 glycosylhydrolase n=1 Tax=Mycolicibacterium sp. CBMA 334 TaxID=2606607 RepID=UPI0012DD0773|nr:family 20 glycosylhydrolase [Mycolicibacterium sp. CBMA 334]MUM00071.1 family 20 glycosylhydrolase [Mycolicibacterium sp. CBMA 334]
MSTEPSLRVIDGPRYAWRGLSLDVVRAFHAPETLRRVIDMCALHKLNVLHLHLTDDQGWRIEVPSRPALTTVGSIGAYGDRPGGYYTVAEMTALSAYAAERFVTLVPEIDMPGHTGAIFHAYPELASGSADDDHIEGVSILNPESEKTWAFVEDVLDAVIPQFPQSAYLHVGGDEAFGMPDEAHAAFVERASALVRARGRLALGWQEIARAELRPDEIVQYWMDSGDSESLLNIDTLSKLVPAALLPLIAETAEKAKHDAPRALSMGTKLIISSLSRLYFDRPHAEASADPAQDELRAHVGFPIYPPLSIRDGVEWDPVDDTPGVPDDSVVAGVEAAIWCETIADRDQLELMLLPRLGGAAEKAWAPRRPTSWDDYAPRLSAQSGIWTARGWNWYQTQEVDWTKA